MPQKRKLAHGHVNPRSVFFISKGVFYVYAYTSPLFCLIQLVLYIKAMKISVIKNNTKC